MDSVRRGGRGLGQRQTKNQAQIRLCNIRVKCFNGREASRILRDPLEEKKAARKTW